MNGRASGESPETFRRRVQWEHTVVEVGQPQANPVRDAWSSWLTLYPWDAWGTMTFAAGEFTHEAATRAWNNFARSLPPLATWFVGHEVGARGRLHMHCLLGALPRDEAIRSQLWEWWFKRYGRCEVRGYDPERGATAYVSKYITKELAHYDLNFDGFTCLSQLPRGTPSWKRWRGTRGSAPTQLEPTQPARTGANG